MDVPVTKARSASFLEPNPAYPQRCSFLLKDPNKAGEHADVLNTEPNQLKRARQPIHQENIRSGQQPA